MMQVERLVSLVFFWGVKWGDVLGCPMQEVRINGIVNRCNMGYCNLLI